MRPRAGDQAVAVRRGNHQVDQCDRQPDRWMPAVLRLPSNVRRQRVPVVALLVARRQRLPPAAHDHVEVKFCPCAAGTATCPRCARPPCNAQALQVFGERQHHALEVGRYQHDLELHHEAAVAVRQRAVLDIPPGAFEEPQRGAQVAAQVAAAVGHGRLVRFRKHLGRQLVAVRFQDGQLVVAGQIAGGQFGIGKVALGALVGAVKQVLIGPLEIEGIGQRSPDLTVFEHIAPGVENERLHTLRIFVRDQTLVDHAAVDRRQVVRRGPFLGDVFGKEVDLAGLERLALHAAVSVVLVVHDAVIVLAAVHRQILAPVIRVAVRR